MFHHQSSIAIDLLRQIGLCIAAAVLCSIPVPVLSQDELPAPTLRTARDYVKTGMKWNAQGKHEQAIADFSKAIELDPTHPVAFCVRANSLINLGKTDMALADCNEAIRLAPRFAAAYHNRGLIWTDVGQPDRAVEDFSEAIRLDPQHTFAYHNRGNVLRKRGEYDKAIADFDAAIRLDSEYSLAYYNRGIVWYDKGQYEKAVADYEHALKLGLNKPYIHNAIAWTRATCPKLSFRNGKTALKHAKIACKLTKSKEYALLDTLAAAYAQANDFESAVSTIKLALEVAPNDKRKELNACLTRYKSGKTYGTD
jgi:tetratricopeptide (TPR) repeat protein